MSKSQVYPLQLSARTQSLMPNLVGLFFMYCLIPDLCFDFTILSSIELFCVGCYKEWHFDLNCATKSATLRNLSPSFSCPGSTMCIDAIRALNLSLDII